MMGVMSLGEAAAVEFHEAVVIGAGHAGLGAAAMLLQEKVDTIVLERSDCIGSSWRSRYNGLHLNIVRWDCSLPGKRIPRSFAIYPSREEYVQYLESYAKHFRIPLRFEAEADTIRRDGAEWLISTKAGHFCCRWLIIATGEDRVPMIPDWPGLDEFKGELIHSSAYKAPTPYIGRSVLVVGSGDSAGDIATKLADGGAAKVWNSFRTPPNIVPPRIFGIRSHVLGFPGDFLPERFVGPFDAVVRLLRWLVYGDLSKYGVARAPGLIQRVRMDRRSPVMDRGYIAALKAGKIEVVQGVAAFDGEDVVLKSGRHLRPDVIIAATGYNAGVDQLFGDTVSVDVRGIPSVQGEPHRPAAPGLYFIGFGFHITGNLSELKLHPRKMARAIARDRRLAGAARQASSQ